jgi:ketosteroid isomerase-like protein
MSETMTRDEIESLADRFFDAIQRGDVAAIRALYAPDAAIWHNYDQVAQGVDDNLRTLEFLVGRVAGRRYEDVCRIVLDDGFVQQHVLRGDAPGGRLEMPAMMRVWVADGRVTRIDEYLDPAQAGVLRSRPSVGS